MSDLSLASNYDTQQHVNPKSILPKPLAVGTTHGSRRDGPPISTKLDKVREMARFSRTRGRLLMKERRNPYKAVSTKGQFMHNYVQPLATWWGKNIRELVTQSLPRVSVQDSKGPPSIFVNCAAHNYAGLYKMTTESEKLQRMCLEKLPVADSKVLLLLETATQDAVADFFGADFCYTTSTGYGSNYVALPAIVDVTTLVILDEHCHNSMFTGTYLAPYGSIHNNMENLESVLVETSGDFRQVIVAIEGLYRYLKLVASKSSKLPFLIRYLAVWKVIYQL